MICKRCGKTIKSKSLKCGSCGEKHVLEECSGFDYKPSSPRITKAETGGIFDVQTPKKNIGLIASVAAVAVVCVVVIFAVFIPKDEDKSIKHSDSENLPLTDNDVFDYPEMSMNFVDLDEEGKDEEISVKIASDGNSGAKEALKLVAGVYGYKSEDVEKEFKPGEPQSYGPNTYYIFDQITENGEVVKGRNMIVTVIRKSENDTKIIVSGNYDPKDRPAEGDVLVGEESDDELKEIWKEFASKKDEPEPEQDVEPSEEASVGAPGKNKEITTNGWSAEVYKEDGKGRGKVIIYPAGESVDTKFAAKVISNQLYVMLDINGAEPNTEQIESVWNAAKYMLTADATHEDIMNAIYCVAPEAYKNLNEKSIGNEPEIILLAGENKNHEDGIVISGLAGDLDEKDYDLNIFEFDAVKREKRKAENLEDGKIYYVEVEGITDSGKRAYRFYVYWKDKNSYLPYGTSLISKKDVNDKPNDNEKTDKPKMNEENKSVPAPTPKQKTPKNKPTPNEGSGGDNEGVDII